MFCQNKEEVIKNKPEEQKKQPTYWERVIKGKGTVAEPWPTAEDLWNDPEVQKSIKEHNQFVKKRTGSYFKKYKKSQSGKQKTS